MASDIAVTELEAARADEAAGVLARAFFEDPAWLWALPEDGRREGVLRWFFAAAVRYGLRAGEVYATASDVAGAAILLPPERPHLQSLRLARVGLWQMPFRAGLGGFRRFTIEGRILDERHEHDVHGPHWYVWLLGVDPPHQRQGIGGAVLGPMLARADEAGVPCYLDTTRERNLAFYGRHGFEVVYEGRFPGDGPPFWTLLRPPGR